MAANGAELGACMILFDQWYLPDGETHLPEWMTKVRDRRAGRLRYQGSKYDAALKHCRHRRVAVDIGSHVGLWAFWMAQDFGHLYAFEPHPDHRACWMKNMHQFSNVQLLECALGAEAGAVTIQTGPSSSGDTYVSPSGVGHRVDMKRLDEFGLTNVDLIKIDCEGYEYYALLGARETILSSRPVIIVEQKPTHGRKYGISDTAGAEWLRTLGYQARQTISGDVILTHPRAA